MIALRVKSDFSYGTALGSPVEYTTVAAELGVRALALTDTLSLAGQVQFHAVCRAYGVRPISGVEVPLGPAGECVMLARGAEGYRNLCRLVTAFRGGARRSDAAAVAALYATGNFILCDDARTLALFRDHGTPADDVALLQPRAGEFVPEHLEQAGREGYLVVADTGVVMPREADRSLFELKSGVFAGRAGPIRTRGTAASLDGVLARSPAGMIRIAERCELDLLAMPDQAVAGDEADRELRALCEARASGHANHSDRLSRELDVIGKMALAPYFLQAHAVARIAREHGISLTARGSAVSSLVVHLLGLSPVDPVAAGLYFERFLRPSRLDPPDIDLDVSSSRRDELVEAVAGHFGTDRVAGVAAHQTFQRRAAYREGLGALGVAPSVIERFCRGIRDDALELPPPLYLLPADIQVHAPVIERLVDRPSHLSTHPSALFVGSAPLDGAFPLVVAPKGHVVIEYDGKSLDRLGYSRLDLLGNHALAQLDETAHVVGHALTGPPMDDAATLAVISAARTVGCHQLETPAMRSILCRLPVRSFEDVVDALALVRPAAGASDTKDDFVARAQGGSVPRHPLLERLLPRTHGSILYEEDVIAVIAAATGLPADEADALREALVRGDDVAARFAARAAEHGLDPEDARLLWAELSRFAAYSFSKAHATSAAAIAYLTAYAKTHHPAAFGCALLNRYGGAYPLRTIAAEIVRGGVQVLPPSVNASEGPCVVQRGAIRVGLERVKHLTRATVTRLLESRRSGGRFQTVADLERRVALGRKEREALVMSGACDGLPPLSRDAYPFSHFAFFGLPARAAPLASGSPDSERLGVYRHLVRIQNELELLGMHLVAHPMAVLRSEAQRAGCVTSAEVSSRPGGRIRFAGLVSSLHHLRRGGRLVSLVTLEDEHGFVEAVSTQRATREVRPSVDAPGPHLVEGRLRGQPGCVRLEIDALRPFHRRDDPYGHG